MGITSRLNIDTRNWSSCKYSIDVILNFDDGTSKTLQKAQITGLYLEKDYDNDHLPIMMLDLAIGPLDVNRINQNTGFHVKIAKFYVENDDSTNERKPKGYYIDDIFMKLDYGTVPNANLDLVKKIRESDGISEDQMSASDLLSQTTYILVKKPDLLVTKKILNNVLTNVTQQEAVSWLLTESNLNKKVLMSNFSNSNRFKELLLIPNQLLSELLYLESEYGWYEEGAYIFLDFDIFYIIRKNGKPTAWLPHDTKKINFCISKAGSDDNGAHGVILQNDIMYVNIGSDQYNYVDASNVEDQITGSNMYLTNTQNGKTVEIRSGIKSIDGVGSYTTKMYHGRNPYVASQFVQMKRENQNVWDVSCNNCDISVFTPQKQYGFLTNMTSITEDLSGSYRISSVKTSFIKSGDFFNSATIVRVKRTSTN